MYLVHIRFPAFPSDDPLVKAKVAPTVQKKITILGRDSKTSLSELSLVQTQTQTQPQSQSQQKSQPQNTTADQQTGEEPNNQEDNPAKQENVEGEEKGKGEQNEDAHQSATTQEEPGKSETDTDKESSTEKRSETEVSVPTSAPGTIRLPPATAKEVMKDTSISTAAEMKDSSMSTAKDSSINTAAETLNYSSVFQSTTDLQHGDDMIGYYSSVDGDRTRTQSLSVAPHATDEKNNGYSESVEEQPNVEPMDYFEGMFTTDLVPGLLPLFNSWSLVVLGSASMYNPQT